MANELMKFDLTEKEIAVRLGIKEEDIVKWENDYTALTVANIDDKEGYAAAHEARMYLVHQRTDFIKGTKKMREEANDFSKKVIKVEKFVVERVLKIEAHLLTQEKVIDDELERKRQALIKAKEEEEAAAKRAEEARIEKVRLDQEAEAKRLAGIAREQAEREAKIKEAEAAIEREKQRVIDEETKRLKKIADDKALEIAKKEAVEKAVKEAEAKRIKEERDKAEKIEKERIAAEKKAAKAPDKLKILRIIDMLGQIMTPDVKTEEGKAVALSIMMSIQSLMKEIRDKAEGL